MTRSHNYYVYIMTNKLRQVLYVGLTNSLGRRVFEHEKALLKGFSRKYNCKFLVYYEHYTDVNQAIKREKQLKSYRREKKIALINSFNPQWDFLNQKVMHF